MCNTPTLFTLYQGSRVRHLLIDGNDRGAMRLSQLIDGVHMVVATGKQYEMENETNFVMREWVNKEGFKYQKDGDPPVFEPLKDAIVLAMLMGHTDIVDPKCKDGRNLLGQVPLANWKGWKDTRGDEYEYGFTGSTLYGQPKVSAKHGLNMNPKDNQEFLNTLRKAVEMRKALGPEHEFLLI